MTSTSSSAATERHQPLAGLLATGSLAGWALANAIGEIVIIFTGGLVRLTGSGLGCPTWPQCVPGSYVPVVEQAQGWHKYVEFGNRMLTPGLVILAVGALIVGVRARRAGLLTRGQWVLALVPFIGVMVQAVLGGITVRMQLSPVTVATHFMLSAVLLILAMWLWASLRSTPVAAPLPPVVHRLSWALAGCGFLVVMMGTIVTGSGPHSGDAHQPARFGFDPAAVSWIHADLVGVFIALLIALIVVLHAVDAEPRLQRAPLHVLGLTALQGALGFVQYYNGLPIPLVSAHMVASGLLMAGITVLAHSVHRAGHPLA